MINFHPNEQLLTHYVSGDLTVPMLIVVGTHVDMCEQCKQRVTDIEAQYADQLFDDVLMSSAQDELAPSYESMLTDILKAEPARDVPLSTLHSQIVVEGKHFTLPPTLARINNRINSWKRLSGNMWRAPMTIDGDEPLNFIYMGKHTKVPEHTHRGNEITLVINGAFCDEANEYRDGDFVLLDQQHTHTPHTLDEDCLILTTQDAPIKFTKGIARLLNPLSQIIFK